MSRSSVAAMAAAVALAGCPLPQPLPDYPPGTITPPRILVDEIAGNAEVVRFVPAGCAKEPVYPLTATLNDANTLETVEARWFVNYDARDQLHYLAYRDDPIPPDPDPLVLTRVVPPADPAGNPQPFQFAAYQYPPPHGAPALPGPPWSDAGIVRVVELVVSNGFDPAAVDNPASPLPNRATLTAPTVFETQVYRWVFVSVAASVSCAPDQPGCVTCPP
ncbi:MAG TPA: hypothetical protein VFL83_21845 [Anaeromyxobacter sp.]|nr:hypothetical protein [Anaeromyxobacter sp.]